MKKRFIPLFFILILAAFSLSVGGREVKADELSDSVKDRISDLDLSEAKDYFSGLNIDNFELMTTLNNLLEGKYDAGENIFDYIKGIFFSETTKLLPTVIGVIIVALLCEIIRNIKSAYLSDSVITVVKFVSILTVLLLLEPYFIALFQNTKNLIENIGKFNEIMSPIIITLMVASGGVKSAAIYKPSTVFFSSVIISVFYSVVLPLIGVLTAFGIMERFSNEIKLKKFSEFFGGILKWIFGIIIVVYGFLITAEGIAASSFDGISAKIAKYAISNSVPIVGGLIKDGMDIVSAGSLIVKNALGVAGVIGIFYFILSPVIKMAVFSLLLKLAAAVTGVFSTDTVPDFLSTVSKSINYLIAAVLTVGLMLFLTVLLMVFSANSVF